MSKESNKASYNRWRLKNPEQHKINSKHWMRLNRGWYDAIPDKIKKLQLDKKVQGKYYEDKIAKLQLIYKQFKQGQVPLE
jgi:hypothetical protein